MTRDGQRMALENVQLKTAAACCLSHGGSTACVQMIDEPDGARTNPGP